MGQDQDNIFKLVKSRKVPVEEMEGEIEMRQLKVAERDVNSNFKIYLSKFPLSESESQAKKEETKRLEADRQKKLIASVAGKEPITFDVAFYNKSCVKSFRPTASESIAFPLRRQFGVVKSISLDTKEYKMQSDDICPKIRRLKRKVESERREIFTPELRNGMYQEFADLVKFAEKCKNNNEYQPFYVKLPNNENGLLSLELKNEGKRQFGFAWGSSWNLILTLINRKPMVELKLRFKKTKTDTRRQDIGREFCGSVLWELETDSTSEDVTRIFDEEKPKTDSQQLRGR